MSSDVYFSSTDGFSIYDRYPANEPNVLGIADFYRETVLQEDKVLEKTVNRVIQGQDMELVHIPSTWDIKTVGEGAYRATLSVGFPVLGWWRKDLWAELRVYVMITSQHDDVSKVAVSIDHQNFMYEKPIPTLTVLPTGDPSYHLSSFLAILTGKIKGVLDQTDLKLTWDVQLHGLPTPSEFGHEITAFITVAYQQLRATLS